MNDWTIGRGIGVGLKWIAVAVIVVALIGFVRDVWFDDNYDDRPIEPKEMELYTITECERFCGNNNLTEGDEGIG